MELCEIADAPGKYILVGMNSQGKTYALTTFAKLEKDKTIYIANEAKADEALKSTTNSSPMIEWLERLLDIDSLKKLIDEQIGKVRIAFPDSSSALDIKLLSTVSNYKGLISAEISTHSNQWSKPGSGETFMGQLYLVEQMICTGSKNPIKRLLIDEPETFLHKNIFANVINILKRLSKQMTVVVSTHSPEFLNMYIDDMSEIILVSNGHLEPLPSDDTFIERALENPIYNTNHPNMKGDEKKIINMLPEYFRHFIRPTVTPCLFGKIAVLGEGVAEQMLFSCLVQQNQEQSFLGYTEFISVFGKYYMPIYLDILQYCGIKTLALFDSDSGNTDAWKESINKCIKEKADKYYTFDMDIENYLGFKCKNKDKNYKGVQVPINIQRAFLTKDEKLFKLMNDLTVYIKDLEKEVLISLQQKQK